MKRLSSVAALLCLGLTIVPAEAATRWTASRAKSKAAVPQAAGARATAPPRNAAPAATPSRKTPAYNWRNARRPAPATPQAAVLRPTHAVTPATPSQDRYREIQQALMEKGYYKGTVDGTWTTESQDALRRFQADQSLTSTGKLDSLSLIALGLGPSRDTSSVAVSPAGAAAAATAGMTR